MAYNETFAERVREGMARWKGIEEKKMFGGIGFLLNGNMCVGVWKDFLIVRLERGQQNRHCERRTFRSSTSPAAR